MPPRPSVGHLVRRLQAPAPQLRAGIASTARNAIIRDIGASSAANKLLDLEDSSTTTGVSQSSLENDGRSSEGGARAVALLKAYQKRDGGQRLVQNKQDLQERTRELNAQTETMKHMTRHWNDGDVYAPHDLSEVEMMKWKEPKRPTKDIIDMVGINPLDHYKNFAMISEFMTDMGRIKHPKETGLRPVNQRKMAKAIRRAIGMGIHPSTHKHPEIIFGETRAGPRVREPRVRE